MSKPMLCPRCRSQLSAGSGLPRCPRCQSAARLKVGWVIAAAAVIAVGLAAVVFVRSSPPANTPQSDGEVARSPTPVLDQPESLSLGWSFRYDDDGAVSDVLNPAGQRTKIRYERAADKAVRKVVRESPDGGSVSREFGPHGRQVSRSDGTGKTGYEYDGLGRLTDVKREGAPAIRYAYDTQDRLCSFRVGDDYALTYEYDFLGRLEAIETPAGRIGYDYSAKDRTVRRTLPNGVRTTWWYAPSGQLERIEHAAKDETVLAGFAYEYRPDGLIRRVTERSTEGENRVSYEYDTVHRLVAVSDTRGRRSAYSYDLLGNREEVREPGQPAVSSTFDWAGRLVRHGGERCSHDAAGNLARYDGTRGPVRLTYTPDGQLQSATTDKVTVGFQYDGDGNLVRREVNGQPTSFVPDPLAETWRPLTATDAAGRQTAYLWDGNAPLAVRVNGEWRFFLHNHQDSVRCVVDARGGVVERPEYCPFGRPLGDGGDDLRPGFAGMFFDSQTATYQTKARAYDPALGRFLQIDPQHRLPTGSQKDLVAYVYCGNDPVNFVDPDGCEPKRFEVVQRGTVTVPSLPATPGGSGAVGVWLRETRQKIGAALIPEVSANSSLWWSGKSSTLIPGTTLTEDRRTVSTSAGAGWSFTWGDRADSRTRLRSYDFGLSKYLGVSVTPFVSQTGVQSAAVSLNVGIGIGPPIGFTDSFPASSYIPDRGGPGPLGGSTAVYRPGPGISPSLHAGPGITPVLRATPESRFVPAPPPGGGGVMTPSRVGGVALSGGAASLAEFGELEGVSLDSQGRLVLLAKGKFDTQLPALRIDDVVTIFRTVYDHGEAPFVSIDPDPKDPMGPTMNIRHGPGTADTYVGWVCFEADRAMKTYNLGQDNITGKPFRSKIAGYDEYLRLLFAGISTNGNERWERFWIVPSEVTHRPAKDGRTALTKVPLKLRTEAMVMRDGKLETAPKGQSSRGAEYFTKWFTDNYEKIARETKSQTPKGSGMDVGVPVFTELQRIAVIAAVAERLRDQGTAMPGWMRTYPVKPFPFSTTTPATTVVKDTGKVRYSIYGGVTLSPPAEAVRTIAGPEADALAPAVRTAVADTPALTSVTFKQEQGELRAVPLPPADAVAVGANQINELDLQIPLAGGQDLRLVRRFESFHTPADVFGPAAWTLDLPRLTKRPGPPAETPGYRRVFFELDSPLRSVSGLFTELKFVPEVNGKLLVPSASGEMLGLSDSNALGFPTHLLHFRDGRQWHFDEAGDLVGVDDLPLTLRFHRDKARRLEKIEGTYGSRQVSIRLEYDDRGRVRKATGSDGQSATYTYDGDGRLERVERTGGKVRYEYRGPLVSAVLADGAPPRRCEYAAGGRLKEERRGADSVVNYEVVAGRDGTKITARGSESGATVAVNEYDSLFRPVRQVHPDGTVTTWRYPTEGATEMTTTPVGGLPSVVRRSADGRREEYRVAGAEPQTVEFDSAGRLRELRRGKEVVVNRVWLPNGLPEAESDATTTRRFKYRADGTLASVKLSPAKGKGDRRSVNLEFDAEGRPATITDESGEVTTLRYDPSGRPLGVSRPEAEVAVTPDEAGRPLSVKTSWGRAETTDYDQKTGRPRRSEVKADGKTASVEYDQGRPRHIRQFDGGELTVSYAGEDSRPEQVRTPNGLELKFGFDLKKRVKSVKCGDACRVEYEYDPHDRLTGLKLVALPR
jgi:RHS repeat-associated protein